ncbi:MAG: hypothetical protein WCL14_07875 [Bacteroidota bacterium]
MDGELGAYILFSSHLRPAIRCSRCIPITDTKQRAAATIGASFDGRLPRKSFQQVTWLWRKGYAFSPQPYPTFAPHW